VLVVRGTRVILPTGERPASIQVHNGSITKVAAYDDVPAGADLYDAGEDVVAPGLVDTHVHVNEPGRTEWEGFDTATRAAAAGGVTTIVDMPLNAVPPTTSVESLETKRTSARGRCHVDVAFWGGVVPGNAAAIDAMVDDGVRGFKCFLAPSGVEEFQAIDELGLRAALPSLSRHDVPLLVHAELPAFLTTPADATYAAHLTSRPPRAESAAIELMVRLAREFDVAVHVVHVSSADGVDAIARAKAAGIRVTAETCPHYLTFASSQVPAGATEFKCAPPIREEMHRAALRDALRSGVLDLVASDHSPSPSAMKCRGDFQRAWGGIASLELALAATWTSLLKSNRSAPAAACKNVTPVVLAEWMSSAPARLAGLHTLKGSIAEGFDADLVVWRPNAERVVEPSQLQQRHKLTPYAGYRLRGVIRTTFLRGRRVWDEGGLIHAGSGRLL
jgi:allantoinase